MHESLLFCVRIVIDSREFRKIDAEKIALLGLFSLSSCRPKLISKYHGNRKVLGATIPDIMSLFVKEMIILIVAANIIAWPVAYYLMHRWLSDFPYRITLSWTIFFGTALLSVLIAQITVTFQALKAAHSDPIDSLRYA